MPVPSDHPKTRDELIDLVAFRIKTWQLYEAQLRAKPNPPTNLKINASRRKAAEEIINLTQHFLSR